MSASKPKRKSGASAPRSGGKRARKAADHGPMIDSSTDFPPDGPGDDEPDDPLADPKGSVMFWEQFATELVLAWELDYASSDLRKSQYDDRDVVILKVLGRGQRPARDTAQALLQLQDIWKRQNPSEAVVPGLYRPLGGGPADGSARPGVADEAPPQTFAPRAKYVSPQPLPGTPIPESARMDAPPFEIRRAQQAVDIPRPAVCRTCAEPGPGAPGEAWKCKCGLRGDLDLDHKINQALLALRTGVLSTPTSVGSSGANTTSSQSSTVTPAQSKSDRGLALTRRM